ncbi:MAG: hypothetical protein IM629_00155 [Phenylobacterium sp.]|nr:hypothetical protein [Phenylobacterium sp.]
MAISNYSELQASIAGWLNRSDLSAVIPDFISLAESQFNRVMRAREMQGQATANINTAFFALPVDFAEVKAMRLTDGSGAVWDLIQATPEQLSTGMAESSTPSVPEFYSILGEQFQIYPPPNGAYVATLIYVRKLVPLSTAAPSNWLLETAPDIYLYGSLVQAAQYLRDVEGLATWKALLEQAIEELRVGDKPVIGPLRTDIPLVGLQRRYNIYSDW